MRVRMNKEATEADSKISRMREVMTTTKSATSSFFLKKAMPIPYKVNTICKRKMDIIPILPRCIASAYWKESTREIDKKRVDPKFN